MLDHISDVVGQVTSQFGEEHGIPTDKMSQVKDETTNSIVDSLKGAISGGNISQITSLLGSGSSSSNPMVSNIVSNLVSNLTEKVGIGKSTADSFAKSIVPKVMDMLGSKNSSSSDSFDVGGVISSLGGGSSKGGGIMGKIGGLFGGK